jgi:hypothetical protein
MVGSRRRVRRGLSFSGLRAQSCEDGAAIVAYEKGAAMPLFTFEVLGPDDLLLVADKRDLPSSAEAWGHLEVLALQLRQHSEVRFRVKDPDGIAIILTGIANPIASIERCRHVACPIKDLLAGRDGGRRESCAPCMSIALAEIPWLDLPESLRRPRVR